MSSVVCQPAGLGWAALVDGSGACCMQLVLHPDVWCARRLVVRGTCLPTRCVIFGGTKWGKPDASQAARLSTPQSNQAANPHFWGRERPVL